MNSDKASQGDHGRSDEFPEFNVTREDLRLLARMWEAEALDTEMFELQTATYAGHQTSMKRRARYQLGRIADVLGDDEVAAVVREVREEMRLCVGERQWRVSCHGTAEEVRQFQDEIQVGLDGP